MSGPLAFFLVVVPGLAHALGQEARAKGFKVTAIEPGGVHLEGDWADIWRANLELRGATRVLLRVASFRAMHLAQLDKRTRKLPWLDWLNPGTAVLVEAVCRKSRIYHDKAAAQRVEKALLDLGMTHAPKNGLQIKLRIEDDLAVLSLDTSGEALHRRGMKEQVNRAPMRETLAAMFLQQAGYDGTVPVLDPMCGSGTFLLEAADIATKGQAGRLREFAFEHLPSFEASAFDALKTSPEPTALKFYGSDRDAGAVAMSKANAERSGLGDVIQVCEQPINALTRPDGPPGLVIANPPYGGRIGKKGALHGLYESFGQVMRERFQDWRVAIVTSQPDLARATGLAWEKPGPFVDHGGTKIRLWQTQL